MKPLSQLCGATLRNGSGLSCRRPVAPGHTRCNLHGGATPLAKFAAQEALARAALPAAELLFEVVSRWHDVRCDYCGHPNGGTDTKDAIASAKTILDRTGFAPGLKVEVSRGDHYPLAHLSNEELAAQAEALAAKFHEYAVAERALRTIDVEVSEDVLLLDEPDEPAGHVLGHGAPAVANTPVNTGQNVEKPGAEVCTTPAPVTPEAPHEQS